MSSLAMSVTKAIRSEIVGHWTYRFNDKNNQFGLGNRVIDWRRNAKVNAPGVHEPVVMKKNKRKRRERVIRAELKEHRIP